MRSFDRVDRGRRNCAPNDVLSGAGKLVGKTVAERALQAGIKKVVFDRGGYVYTGRVAEVAAGAREAGLDF